jgi:hypothetical protein
LRLTEFVVVETTEQQGWVSRRKKNQNIPFSSSSFTQEEEEELVVRPSFPRSKVCLWCRVAQGAQTNKPWSTI